MCGLNYPCRTHACTHACTHVSRRKREAEGQVEQADSRAHNSSAASALSQPTDHWMYGRTHGQGGRAAVGVLVLPDELTSIVSDQSVRRLLLFPTTARVRDRIKSYAFNFVRSLANLISV